MRSKLQFQVINTKERNTSLGSILEVTSGVLVLMSGPLLCLLFCLQYKTLPMFSHYFKDLLVTAVIATVTAG